MRAPSLAEIINAASLGEGKRPAQMRPTLDDSAPIDLSTLPLFAAGVKPLELPKLGQGQNGVIVPNGEFGGLLLTLDPGARRPLAAPVGRPILRYGDGGLFGWRSSTRAWGTANLEFFRWYEEQDPNGQIAQILLWSQGYAQPTGDVVVTTTVVPAANRLTTVVTRLKGAAAAAFALQPNNIGTTIRNRAYTSSGVASIGTLAIALNAAALAAGNTIELGPGEFAADVPGALYFDNDELVVFEVVEALS